MSDRSLVAQGVRGTTPVSGPQFERFGGSTTCYSVEAAPGHILVIDCGTGLQRLERHLPAEGEMEFTILLTHYHWDHIGGLPIFGPLQNPHSRFTFYGRPRDGADVGDILDGAIRPPFFPATLRERPAGVVFADLEGPLAVGPMRVTPVDLHHPQGSVGFRIDAGSRSVMIATDHETGDPDVDAALVEAAGGVDVLIHDAQYTPEEIAGRRGWGHSTWADGVAAATACGAGRLVLTSHDRERTDDLIDDVVRLARARFPLTSAAYPGMAIPL